MGSPWAVDGLDPPSAHAHQPSRHYFCWAWALGGVNGRSIIRRLNDICRSMIQYILVLKSYLGCTQIVGPRIVGVGELAHQATISMDTLYVDHDRYTHHT